MRPHPRRSRGRLLLVRGAGLFVASAILSITGALLAGDGRHVWWYVGTTLSGATAFFLGSLTSSRWNRRIHVAIAFAASSIVLVAFLQGAGVFELLGILGTPHERTALWFGNPNILAACLALAGLYLVRSAPPTVALTGLLVAVPAIMFTGSRGALAGLGLATASDLLVRPMGVRRLGRLVLVLVPVVALVALLVTVGLLVPRGRNLLHQSATPTAPSWQRMTDELSMALSPEKGPRGQSGVWSLAARTPRGGVHPGLILTQSVGRSGIGRSYVASVYVRSDIEAYLVLSTNLSSKTCHVTRTWTRCVTPPGVGDGHRIAQFQLRTVHAGEAVSVLLWGAQLEYGSIATPVVPTTRLSRTIQRLDPLTWPGSYGWTSRIELQRDAWHLFLQDPWVGSGLGSFHRRLETIPTHYPTAQHAQNLVLNLLVETGVLGLIAWVLPLVGLLAHMRRRWRIWLPLMMLTVVLNTIDATFFTAGFFYLFWFLVGDAGRWEDSPSPTASSAID